MPKNNTVEVTLRPKRQLTLPRDICERLGIGPGDALELYIDHSVLIAKPRKSVAVEALREIREAFQRSGVTEKQLQAEGRRVRSQILRERRARA